jgi:hypothetical protein
MEEETEPVGDNEESELLAECSGTFISKLDSGQNQDFFFCSTGI